MFIQKGKIISKIDFKLFNEQVYKFITRNLYLHKLKKCYFITSPSLLTSISSTIPAHNSYGIVVPPINYSNSYLVIVPLPSFLLKN